MCPRPEVNASAARGGGGIAPAPRREGGGANFTAWAEATAVAARQNRLGSGTHEELVPFVAGVRPPRRWECQHHGGFMVHESLVSPGAEATEVAEVLDAMKRKNTAPRLGVVGRSHWDMLRDRRSLEELQVILDEQLEKLRASRS